MNTFELLAQLAQRKTALSDYEYATRLQKNVPIYDCLRLTGVFGKTQDADALKEELVAILVKGPGVFVLQGAYADIDVVDAVTQVFMSIIEQEKTKRVHGGDHFAESGANDRIWNSLEKLCIESPAVFARYHSNQWVRLASEAWLGPAYQMTAQVNLVHPGGKSQSVHCDYHLGFMTQQQAERFPAHVHEMSSRLTLQGAIAHVDMPTDSGPTRLLPYSQLWPDNYRLFREQEVHELFDLHSVQVEMRKGDIIFFSPALLHAAGENRSQDIKRLANLLQVSSPFGRPMETVNRTAMCKRLYPVLVDEERRGQLGSAEVDAVIASTAEGYPFPTNLDTDPPLGGLAPLTQQAVFRKALAEKWTEKAFHIAIDERDMKRVSSHIEDDTSH